MLKINGLDWRIMLTSSNHPQLMRPNGSFTLGCCNNKNKTIYIVEGLNRTYFKKVLCHELVHAFLFESGLGGESWANNEELVDWIAFQFPKMLEAMKNANAL